jgi:hypothetical protein
MIVINGFIHHVWEYHTQHMTTWRIHQCHGTVQTATDQITQLYRTTLVAVSVICLVVGYFYGCH